MSSYATTDSLSSYSTKTDIDASLALYSTKTDIDASLALYSTKSVIDASLALYSTKSVIDASLTNYALTSSLSSYASLISDVSFAGNIKIGSSRAVSLGINKTPSALFALDVSGPTSFFGNVSMDKRTTDISYAYFDMSSVTMNVYNLCEKFVTMPTIASVVPVVCNYVLGSIFYFPSTTSSVITSVSFTNVPVVIGRSVTITVIIENSTHAVVSWLNPSGTPATISVNGQAIAYKTQDGTVFAAPAPPGSGSGYWQVIHQFIMLFTSATLSATNPRIIGSMATIK